MILEGIVTTLAPDGRLNVAPMGPRVSDDWTRFVLRPFQTSTTFANLMHLPEGVLHVTDDVLLLARTAIGLDVECETRPAEVVRGRVLLGACRYYEFRVRSVDDSQPRATMEVETVTHGWLRDVFGFNRAKHAIVEAAILATRVGLLPLDEILSEFRRLASPVEKTGGPAEHAAYELLLEHVRQVAASQGLDLDRLVP